MSAEHYYDLCHRNIGVPVEITCHDGTVHRGIIDRVDRTHVYLRPFDGARPGFDGPGTYFWGFGLGFGLGFGAGIALGSIGTLAFLPWFCW